MVSRPYATGSVDGLSIYNNTLYNTHGSTGIRLQSPFSGTNPNQISNSLIVRTTGATPISTTTTAATSDNKVFFTSSGSLGYVYNGTSYATLAAYRAASGQEQHSLKSNPSMNVPSTLPGASMPMYPNFSVPTASSAVGAGAAITGNGGIDFYGKTVPTGAPTIGAVIPQ